MSAPGLRRPANEKLRFLAQVVRAEADLLTLTDGRLFAVPMEPADLGVQILQIHRRRGHRVGPEDAGCACQQLVLPVDDLVGVHVMQLG